jgi:hypothetical protein
MSDQPCRRTFLQVMAGSLLLPRVLLSGSNSSPYWFLHDPSGESWQVDDPIAWCLQHARHHPVLSRARQRLLTLTSADQVRIVRLVTRRCHLRLIVIGTERVSVHYWSRLGDLRAFFKAHGLAQRNVPVTLLERKHEAIRVTTGNEFLFGNPLRASFPVDEFLRKWHRRQIVEPDDWTASEGSWSTFAWEGVEPCLIPWAVLKAVWSREQKPCPNCDQPAILVGFGLLWCGMGNRTSRFTHICPTCRTHYEDEGGDVVGWMMANLKGRLLPAFGRGWGKLVAWQPPARTAEVRWSSFPLS